MPSQPLSALSPILRGLKGSQIHQDFGRVLPPSLGNNPKDLSGCFGENSGVKLQPCKFKRPICHYKYEAEIVSGRVRLMADEGKPVVWRTTLSLEDDYVFLVPLTQTDLGGRTVQGRHYSWGINSGSHHLTITRFQFGTLTLTHSIPCPTSALLSPCIFSSLLSYLWKRLSLPLH